MARLSLQRAPALDYTEPDGPRVWREQVWVATPPGGEE
jgi:hypothetical protein